MLIAIKTNIHQITSSSTAMFLLLLQEMVSVARTMLYWSRKSCHCCSQSIKHLCVIRDNSSCNVSKWLQTCRLHRLFAKQNTLYKAVAVIKYFSCVSIPNILNTSKQGRVGGEI